MYEPTTYRMIEGPEVYEDTLDDGRMIFSSLEADTTIPLQSFSNLFIYNNETPFKPEYISDELVQMTRTDESSTTIIRLLHDGKKTLVDLTNNMDDNKNYTDFIRYDKLIKQRLNEFNITDEYAKPEETPVYDGKSYEGVLSLDETIKFLEKTDSYETLAQMKKNEQRNQEGKEWAKELLKSL